MFGSSIRHFIFIMGPWFRVVVVAVRMSFSAVGMRVLLMGVIAIDDMGGNVVMDETRYNANDDNASQEQPDKGEGSGSGR